MKAVPHTIDNLCKKDKSQVIEMLKQLNELKKRCASLETEIESQTLENQRISGRDDVLAQQLDATESKLFEFVELSKDAQSKIESLTLNLQKIQSDNNLIKTRISESESEVELLRETYRQLQLKHDHVLVETGVLSRFPTKEIGTNTTDYSTTQGEIGIQAPEVSQDQNSSLTEQKFSSTQFVSETSGLTNLQEPDQDVLELIKLLNNL